MTALDLITGLLGAVLLIIAYDIGFRRGRGR